jgi:coproporphyrinogen III oxidase-like Fe-S oxidoreductase
LASKRAYTFKQLKEFFQQLSLQKSPSVRYNLDLIAFGKLLDGIPWGQEQVERFESLLEQKLFDSISLYTLELFPGSDWYHQSHHTSKAVQKVYGNDDMIFDEFLWLRNCIYTYGYTRQELSNFALPHQGSLHNDVYWSMHSYLGLGINASSYLTHLDSKDFF